MRTLARLGCALAAVGFALIVCAAAQARVILGVGIDGVRLGMTHSAVARVLGHGSLEPGGGQYDYRRDTYQVVFVSGHVTSVETFARSQRTLNGMGVGTSLARLRARDPDVRCVPSNGELDCYLGSIHRGHRYTDFYFEDGPSSMTAVIVGDGYV
jgi:hypothetical protein